MLFLRNQNFFSYFTFLLPPFIIQIIHECDNFWKAAWQYPLELSTCNTRAQKFHFSVYTQRNKIDKLYSVTKWSTTEGNEIKRKKNLATTYTNTNFTQNNSKANKPYTKEYIFYDSFFFLKIQKQAKHLWWKQSSYPQVVVFEEWQEGHKGVSGLKGIFCSLMWMLVTQSVHTTKIHCYKFSCGVHIFVNFIEIKH